MAIDILDRSITPAFQTIQEVFIPPVKNVTLSNGLPLHIINVGEQPIIKLELIFNAGNWFDDNKGISFLLLKCSMKEPLLITPQVLINFLINMVPLLSLRIV
jgi:hypothetical protein